MQVIGQKKDSCCQEKKAFEIDLGAPVVRRKKSNADGLVIITFD
jgi:hypothetical protein